jgi:hypothetical protein
MRRNGKVGHSNGGGLYRVGKRHNTYELIKVRVRILGILTLRVKFTTEFGNAHNIVINEQEAFAHDCQPDAYPALYSAGLQFLRIVNVNFKTAKGVYFPIYDNDSSYKLRPG